MDLNEQILELIQAEVDRLGTKTAFAKKVGTFSQTVGRWLSREAKSVKEAQVPGLARALNLSEMQLFAMSKGVKPEYGGFLKGAPEAHGEIQELAEWLVHQDEKTQQLFFALKQNLGAKG